jgi:hypothetical protein
MAGVKITDLGTLTAPESADLLYIVDVSDTSQSPQGTSKQIELGNIVNSGIFYPITNAVLSANVVSVAGSSYAQYFVSGKSMILGVYFQDLDIDFDADTNASILIDLPTDTSYSAASASGSASIIFSTAPTAAATPVFSLCQFGGSGKVEIKLQNYGGEVSDIYDITATFVIELV